MNTTPTRHVQRRHRRGFAALATFVLVAFVAACGSDDKSNGTTSPEGSGAAVEAPVVVDVADLDGSTVEVRVGGTIDINVPEGTVADWSADIADPAIAHFVAGRTDGYAAFNPGIIGDKVGTTDVTLADGSSTSVVFSVRVEEN